MTGVAMAILNNNKRAEPLFVNSNGKRVKRITAGQEWWYVYGIGGELLAEYLSTAPTTVKKEYRYRGGQALVVYDSMLTGNAQLKWMVIACLGSL